MSSPSAADLFHEFQLLSLKKSQPLPWLSHKPTDVDLVMSQAEVTAEEAKQALQQCEGDIVDAILLLVGPITTTSDDDNAQKDDNNDIPTTMKKPVDNEKEEGSVTITVSSEDECSHFPFPMHSEFPGTEYSMDAPSYLAAAAMDRHSHPLIHTLDQTIYLY